MPRKHSPIEQAMAYELDNITLAFLSKPSTLVLKDNWLALFEAYFNYDVSNCPDFQLLMRLAKTQCNVINVEYDGERIGETISRVIVPGICFKKNVTTEPLMKGE